MEDKEKILTKLHQEWWDKYCLVINEKYKDELWEWIENNFVPLDLLVTKSERFSENGAVAKDEKLITSAIKYTNGNGHTILFGLRHHNCIAQYCDLGFRSNGYREVEQGFYTNKNRFVSRAEAKEIAIKAGQLRRNATISKTLTSEDLW